MLDLKSFRKANGLTQTELGKYLDMKKSFVSKIENGREKLSLTKFQKLMNNDRGWDTYYLDVSESVLQRKVENAGLDQEQQKLLDDSAEITVKLLQERLVNLEKIIDSKDKEIDRLNDIVTALISK